MAENNFDITSEDFLSTEDNNIDVQSESYDEVSESDMFAFLDGEKETKEEKKKKKKKESVKPVAKNKQQISQKQKTINAVNTPIETDFSALGGPAPKWSFKEAGKTPEQKTKEAKFQAEAKKATDLEQASMERRYAKAAAAKKNKEFLAQTRPSDDYLLDVDNEIKTKMQQDGQDEKYMDYGRNEFSQPVERVIKINSFPVEKKEVITELQKAGTLAKYNEKDILELAAKKYKKKKIAGYINDQTINFYTNASEETKAILEDYNKKDRDFKKLDLEKKATINGKIYDHLKKTSKDVEDLELKLKEYGDKPVFKTQEELNEYKDLYKEYSLTRKSANELLNTFRYNNTSFADSEEKLKSAEEEYDLARRNYGLLTGAGVRVFGGLADMGGGILQLANFVNILNPYRDEVAEYLALSTREGQERREAYIGQQESITDARTFGKATFNVVASQLPNWLLMYATGGSSTGAKAAGEVAAKEIGEGALAEGAKLTAKQIAEKSAADIGLGAFKTVAENNQYAKLMDLAVNKLVLSPELTSIAAVSAGQKYSEQKASNALGETQFTPLQMLSSSILYGYVEGLSEKITLDILKGGGRTLESLVKQDSKFVDLLKEQTLSSWFKTSAGLAGKKITDFTEENISEQFANLAQNSVDKFILGKNVNLLDNTGEVFKDTSLLGAFMISAPHIAGLAIKPFLSGDQTKAIKQNSAEIAKIVELLKNPDLSAEEKTIFKGKIKELSAKSETIFKNTIKDIDGMPASTFKTILSKSNQLGSILQKAKNIYNSESADKMDAIKILEAQYKQKETELNSIIGRTKMISQLKGEFSSEDKGKLFNLTNKAEDLKNEIKSLKDEPASEAVVAEKNEQLKSINEKIGNILSAEKVAAFSKKTLAAAKGAGLAADIFEFDTSEEAEAKANELKQSLIDADGNRAEGLEYNGILIIDREQAAKTFAFNVTGHEFLHKVLRKTLYNIEEIKDEEGNITGYKTVGSEAARGLANAMKSYLNGLNPELLNDKDFKERLSLYNSEGKTIKAEETLTLFADALRLGQLKLEENALTKIGDYIRRMLQDWGFVNIKFKDGKDVVNFLKDYNKAIEKGKLGKAITKVAKEGAEIVRGKDGIKKYKDDYTDTVKLSKSEVAKVEKKIEQLEDQLDNDEIDYNTYENKLDILEKELEKAKKLPEEISKPEAKKETSEEDDVKELIKNEKGSVSSDKVQKIYEEKGENGAQDIINLFKPITRKLVNRRKDAPGFDEDIRQLLTDEIETGIGGILYLIRSYKPEKGVPLAAYINKQLPLRAIAASRRVLDKDFSKDVTEEKGLIAEETVSEVKEKPKYKNALESKVFSSDVLGSVNKKVLAVVRTLKSRIDAPVSLNRTVTPLISEIRDEVGKQLDIDVKTAMGGKKDNQLQEWLLKNKRYVLENMTTTWLMGKDGQGGIPQAIQKQIDGKWVNYPDWVNKKIDRETTSTDLAGRTSGAELVRRLPNVANNVSDTVFLDQVIGPDGNPIRGRKESLAKAVAEELAFDIINDDLENQGPIYEALATNQTRLGVEVLENFPVTFQKDSDRGNVKYSKTFNNFNQEQKDYIYKESYKLADELSNINYGLRPTKEDIFNALEKVYSNSVISVDELKELSKDIFNYYTPKLAPALKTQNIDYVKNFIEKSLERNSNKLEDAADKGNDIATQLFTDETSLLQAQSFTSDFISYLGKNHKGEELTSRLRKIGMFLASQAQIGDDSFVIINNKLERQEPRPTASGRIKKVSYQLFSSKPSFWNFVEKALGTSLPEKYNLNRKGYIEDDSKKLYANKNNKEYLENKKATALENQDFLFEILDWYYDPKNNVPSNVKAMLWASLNTNGETPLRKAAIAKWVFDPNSGPSDHGPLRYEHLKSVDKTKVELYKLFKNNSDLTIDQRRDLFNGIMSDYNVAVIPIRMDKEIGELGFQREGIIGDDYEGNRYYNIVTKKAKNLYSLINLDPNAEVKTLGKEFVTFTKAHDAKNEITIDAINNSQSKKSKTPKGISVFDFDDTVGLTKSNVLYTMPDGSTGKLTGEEFAKDGARLLGEGAVFNFSEFSKVVEGKPGPMVEKMKKMIGKFGPENFFILTARPADAALPIKEFLDSIDINIPLENITGLGNSTAQAKADWITAKAAEGYNDFYFTDDAPQNVEAVKTALEVSGIKSKVQQAIAGSNKIGKGLLSSSQAIDLQNEIEANYNPKGEVRLGTDNNDIRTRMFNYDNPVAEKTTNGVNIRITEGLIRNGKGTFLLYADGKVVGEFNSANDAKAVIKYIEQNLVKPKAIENVLNVVDIKYPIQQGKAKFSKTLSADFNKIIEENKGVESFKVFSDIGARRRGAKKNKFDFYVPPSAADFELLLYKFIGKGALGEEQKEFFAKALLMPYTNGVTLMESARQSIKNEYKKLLKAFPGVKDILEKLTPDSDFTYDQAIRVAMWSEGGKDIPGISDRDKKKLTDLVENDPELNAFKIGLTIMGRQGIGWVEPLEYWDSNTIIADLHNITEGDGRKKFLGEFIENVEEIFGKFKGGRIEGPNMNKVEAIYGTTVREALEDVIYRMISGKNKSFSKDRETSAWNNWVNGSTGTIMFLNTRSAALQLIGAINFLNFRDNNPYAAAKAFANQPQYWKDFAHIWNSNKMKERRGGLKEDVAAAEIANAASGSKNKVNAVVSYLLKIGYTPTQLADSFAIASGGAPFYRNRIKSYQAEYEGLDENGNLKRKYTDEQAEKLAWNDFTKVSDETQQSGDPRDISKQQASPAGRLLLTFQNTAMQQSRIVKKAILDLKNRRGDDKTNISKIVYYLTVQNLMFAALQQGLFAVFFDDDEEEKKKKTGKEQALSLADDVLDTILRGTGFGGGIIATLKNMVLKYNEEQEKEYKADYAKVVLEGANISPPIGSKLKKLYSGIQQTKYDKDLIEARGWGVMQDGRVHLGPNYSIAGKLTEAAANVPLDRVVNKIENVSQAMNAQNAAWQRVMLAMGWSPYSVGLERNAGDLKIREEAKAQRKEEGKIKAKLKREATKDSILNLPEDEYKKYVLKKKAEKDAKKDSLANLSFDEKQKYIKAKIKTKELREKEKEILKQAKADSIADLSPSEKANYDKQVALKKAAEKKESHEKYVAKKKALNDSLAKLSPREREKYKAAIKAERHQYYLDHKDKYTKTRKAKKAKKDEEEEYS